ncbi:MAG: FAD-dependent oxidoreductase [Paludibacteraceae bacterium]|nr:FAD-dependent oxidoreductase [Paludibacteraceae bacterium]
MQSKKLIIIGGGVAGLTAGIYAHLIPTNREKAGLTTTIYERHTLPGGLLSYWQRRGYLLDNCVHWLTGTNSSTPMYRLWQDVGVLSDEVSIHRPAYFMQVEHNGETLHLWRDLTRVREDMLRLSPDDAPRIEEFIRLVRTYRDTVIIADKPLEQYSLWQKAKLIYSMRHIGKAHRKYAKMSIARYAEQFRHPLIRKFLQAYFPVHYNVSSLFFVFGIFTDGNADLPAGGSRGMVERMVSRYQSLGGVLQTGWEAERVNIVNHKAVSVTFRNGQTVEADYIILACDLHHAITRLLPVGYMDKYMWERFMGQPDKYPTYSSVNLYFAVNHRTTTIPEARILDLSANTGDAGVSPAVMEVRSPCRTTEDAGNTRAVNGLRINGKPIPYAFLKHFNYELSFSPADTTILQVLITQYADDFDYWQQLRTDNYQTYRTEKGIVAQSVADCLVRTFPELADALTVLDVCTPATNHRFCNTYQGAYMSFALTPYNKKVTHDGRLRGLHNVYLAGQWLQAPGGLPNAAVTGKFAIQRLLHDHRHVNLS